jgi:hypothetical protein
VLIVARDRSLPVKIGGLLSLASDTILGNRLFGGDGLFESSGSELDAGERVLISSGINVPIDLVTERV